MTQPRKSVAMDSGLWRAVHWLNQVCGPAMLLKGRWVIRSVTVYEQLISIRRNIWKNGDWCYSGGQIFWMRTERNVSVRLIMQRSTIHLNSNNPRAKCPGYFEWLFFFGRDEEDWWQDKLLPTLTYFHGKKTPNIIHRDRVITCNMLQVPTAAANMQHILCSLIGTCRLNGINPEAYLRHILSVLSGWPSNRVDELLPWNVALTNK